MRTFDAIDRFKYVRRRARLTMRFPDTPVRALIIRGEEGSETYTVGVIEGPLTAVVNELVYEVIEGATVTLRLNLPEIEPEQRS